MGSSERSAGSNGLPLLAHTGLAVAEILSLATKSGSPIFQGNICRKTHSQKSQFRDRYLRQKVFHI
jgi:hypothetical protein